MCSGKGGRNCSILCEQRLMHAGAGASYCKELCCFPLSLPSSKLFW